MSSNRLPNDFYLAISSVHSALQSIGEAGLNVRKATTVVIITVANMVSP